MNKRCKMLLSLALIIFETCVALNTVFPHAVSATYVEDHITQNTTWTLVDSPIVLSKDVTVDPGVVLTVEPGVEVRFGGNFSLYVEGSIYAVGTESRPIAFTSNKDKPSPGDWFTLKFSSTTQSTMSYCKVKYATNGITALNGRLTVENTEISWNSQNGISVSDSELGVENCIIANNVGAGISATGANQSVIQNNTLRENSMGVLFTGNFVSGVILEQNLIMLNTESGIQLNAEVHAGLTILYNILSANNLGFHVATNTSSTITNNSVSYNKIGFLYEQGTGHSAHFNDIYGNDYGMDVMEATVDATYNYWGDETGPYHTSLNPDGEGDQVGGDGTNLDFIFFLSDSIYEKNEPPTAQLLSDLSTVRPSQTVTFFGTTSSDEYPGHVDQYYLDFGDGQNSSWTTLSAFNHAYGSEGVYYASLTVRDDFGVTSPSPATVRISAQNPPMTLRVSLNPSDVLVGSEKHTPITVQATNAATGLSVEGVNMTFLSIASGDFTPYSGLTNSTGHFVTTFNTPKVNEKSYVRIIVTASRVGYSDASAHEYLEILPILAIQVAVSPAAVKSEATSNVTALVTYNSLPIPNATVTVSSNSQGGFNPATATTDSDGSATFIFTAPQTTTELNVTISARAEKTDFYYAENQTILAVSPRTLGVIITASPEAINSTTPAIVVIKVIEDSKPIEGATVTVAADAAGSFSSTTGNTDANGTIRFDFIAAETTTPVEVTITASAAKTGYLEGQSQTKILAKPVPGPEPITVLGISLTTLLLIIIPIAVAIVIVVLIKKRIIVVSRENE